MKNVSYLLLILWITASSCRKSNPADPTTDPVTEPIAAAGALISTSTEFPTADDSFVMTFDASKGNKTLYGKAGDVYIYTGVITDKSTSQTDWKYVKSASFNEPDAAAKMTAAGSDKYQITIEPRKFYGVPATEKVLKLVMLFKNADGSLVARNSDGSDIYLPIYESGKLAVKFNNPEFNPTFNPTPIITVNVVGDEVSVAGVSSLAAELSLSLNGANFAMAANAKSIAGKAKISNAGNQEIKIKAVANGATAEAAFQFVVTGAVQVAELPSGAKEGVVFINGGQSAILTLTAPGKQSVYAIGDFNNWQANAAQFMKRTPDGNKWWIQIDQLDASKSYTYQYLVDGNLKVADPYSEVVLDPDNDKYISATNLVNLPAYPAGKTNGIVSVMQANSASYRFKNSTFNRPEKNKLVVYELHLRDFLKNNNYNTLTDTLNYLGRLGVNAVELMPITEFEGNSSWGYNPSFHFAADKFYGNKVMLQRFIDECHSRGIAVILDMVLNHAFGQSPMVQMYFDQASGKPASNSPWFNTDPTHPYNVGYDFNHESAATKSYVKNVLKYWMQEYKIDGYRFDLSKGFTQKNSGTSEGAVGPWGNYDASRVAIWKDYNNYIKSLDANNFYVILEHFADDNEEKELAGQGMMLWNNINGSFNEATMGYLSKSDFSRGFFGTHGFTIPDNLVTYMQSHDEERTMTKNLAYGNAEGTYNVKDLNTALKREELAAAFFFAIPGPKMLWQFQELGYDVGIDINGRTGEKPVYWNYYQQPARKALYNAYARFIKLKKNNPVFNTSNLQSGVAGAIKYIKLTDNSNTVVVVGNFDVKSQAVSVDFGAAGNWYEAGSNQTINLGTTKFTQTLAPGEYHIYSKSPLAN
jgi:1,4-alpha-glucan branching enzyme